MKNLFLSFFMTISMFFITSCTTLENVAYTSEYVVGNNVYPVYYIDSYPYYWYENTWILVPHYRYVYIRHINTPRYIRTYRPRPHRYYTPRPNNRYGHGNYNNNRHRDGRNPSFGTPRTRQPNNGHNQHVDRSNGNGRSGSRR